MEDEEAADQEPPGPGPHPSPVQAAAAQKPGIRIRDLGSGPQGCAVCGERKAPYVEVEVDGRPEYTCKECYDGQVVEIVACAICGGAMEPEDHFCGKCGTPRPIICRSCGTDVDEEDRFCGKCGFKVR